MTDKEIENLIKGQIKDVPEIDNNIINDDLQFNIEEFKEKINNSVLQFSNINIEQLKKINNVTNGIKEDFNEVIQNSNNMNDALNQLSGGICPVLNQKKKERILKKIL